LLVFGITTVYYTLVIEKIREKSQLFKGDFEIRICISIVNLIRHLIISFILVKMEVRIMSRMGNVPVAIPEKVDIDLSDTEITVKGPLGELTKQINPRCNVKIEDDAIIVERVSDSKNDRALHGLVRSVINNMVQGVTEYFEKKLEMVGVGYGAQIKGGDLEIEVGFSHPVVINKPEDIEFEVENGSGNVQSVIIVKGIDKQQVGEVAASIREIRKPEPYKGKGIRYQGEQIRRKEGKTG